ncbi:hypothetical protein MBH78_13705 [Oceanimonas sp. NS1]|nr:hypothetical protein [Oceanimonas sp. NS1]
MNGLSNTGSEVDKPPAPGYCYAIRCYRLYVMLQFTRTTTIIITGTTMGGTGAG